MGEVYLAQDTRLDRKVALKILPADLAANEDRMRRFVLEAKAAAALNRPNIELTHRPANVPQRYANQAEHARYAEHARTFFPQRFVSIENKGSKIQLPKLKVTR